MKKQRNGFSLLELTVVIAIIAFLSMMAVPHLMSFLAKAKRSEAYIQLRSLHMQEKLYFSEHGRYTSTLGSGGLNWKPEGQMVYSYSCNPQNSGFTITARGDIDGDGNPDVITINEQGVITITTDDLA